MATLIPSFSQRMISGEQCLAQRLEAKLDDDYLLQYDVLIDPQRRHPDFVILHSHQFRHTYATNLLLQGVNPTHAKRLTGHRSEQAFRRYVLRSAQEAEITAYYRAIGEMNLP